MLNSITIAAPVLLPLMSFGIVFYLMLRGRPVRVGSRQA